MKKINQHLKVGKKVIVIPLSEKVEQWSSSFLELIYFKQKKEFTQSQFDLLTKIHLCFFHHLKSYLRFFFIIFFLHFLISDAFLYHLLF